MMKMIKNMKIQKNKSNLLKLKNKKKEKRKDKSNYKRTRKNILDSTLNLVKL